MNQYLVNVLLFDLVRRGVEPFAVEGVPISGHLRAVWVLDHDTIDRKEDFGGFADSKIMAKGSSCNVFNL